MLPKALANVVVVLVSVVWAVNFAAPLFVANYTADPQLNLVFMTIVGGALALKSREKPGGDQ